MAAKRTVSRFVAAAGPWLPVVLWMTGIFVSSSVPGEDIPFLFPQQDVLYHGIIYVILGLFLYRALHRSLPRMSWRMLVLVAALCATLFGVSDELHQTFVSGRTATLKDLIVDFAGSFLGAFVKGIIAPWLSSHHLRQ
ncbi:MAG: VanZ family protein [Candidatus Omnitrophica bacterium]|nr:VanZ family protein [Candidatus Omnitrophota bacterium]